MRAISLDCFPIVYDCQTGPREILSGLNLESNIADHGSFEVFNLGVLLNCLDESEISKAILYSIQNEFSIEKQAKTHLLSQLQHSTINDKYSAIFTK